MTHVTIGRRDAGDVGRRIAERQGELNLTVAEVAERAGMAPDYLEYLEDTPTAEPSTSALMRIALALEMSVSGLLGGEEGRADGWAPRRLIRTWSVSMRRSAGPISPGEASGG